MARNGIFVGRCGCWSERIVVIDWDVFVCEAIDTPFGDGINGK